MPQFPTSVADALDLLTAANNKSALLDAAIGSGDAIIPVNSTTGFPTSGYLTFEDNTFEIVFYTGKTPTAFTGCTRGVDGSAAQPHSLGVAIGMWQNAAYHNILVEEMIAIEQNLADRLGLEAIRIRFQPGSAGAPTIVANNDNLTGIFSSGAGFMDFAATGSHVFGFDVTGVTIQPGMRLRIGDGDLLQPGAAFTADLNTGIRRIGTDHMGLVTGGVDRMALTSAGFVGVGITTPGWHFEVYTDTDDIVVHELTLTNLGGSSVGPAGIALAFDIATDNLSARAHGAGLIARRADGAFIINNTVDRNPAQSDETSIRIMQVGQNPIQFYTDGVLRSEITGYSPVLHLYGAEAIEATGVEPVITLIDSTTGKGTRLRAIDGGFRIQGNAGGPYVDLLTLTNAGDLSVSGIITGGGATFPLLAPNGTIPNPSYSFTDDPDTGIRRDGLTGNIIFQRDGATALSIDQFSFVGIRTNFPQNPLDVQLADDVTIRTLISMYNQGPVGAGLNGARYVIDTSLTNGSRVNGAFWERSNDGRMILGNTEARNTDNADNREVIIRQVGEHPIIFDIAGSPAVTFRSETYPAAIISTVGQQHQLHMEGFNAFYSMRDTQFNKTVRVRTVDGNVLWLDEAFATMMTLTELGALTTLLSLNATTSVSAGTFVSAGTISSAVTAFRGPDGTVSVPGYAFTSDVDTGLYLTGGAIHYARGGVDQGEILAGSASVSFPLLAPDGSAAAPSYSWSSSNDWGFYHVPFVSGNPGRIVVAVDGFHRFTFRAPNANAQQPFLGIGTLDPSFMLDINAQEDGAEDILEAVRINNRRGSDGTNAFRGIYMTLRQSINNVGGNSEVAEIRRHMDGRLRIVNYAAFHSSHTQDQQTILEGEGGTVKIGVPTGNHWVSVDANGRIGLDSNPVTALKGAGLSATRFISFGRDTGTESAMLELVGNQAGAAYVGGVAVTNGATAFSSIETHRGSGGDGILKLHVKDGAGVWGLEMDANPSFRTIIPTNSGNTELGLLASMFRSVYSVRHLGDLFFLFNAAKTQTVGHAAKAALSASPTYYWPEDGAAGEVLSTDGAGNLAWIAAGGGVTWPLTATDYLDMANNILYLGNTQAALIKYSTDHGAIFINSSGTGAQLTANGEMSLYSNTGADGSGNWSPGIEMYPDARLWLRIQDQGIAGSRYVGVFVDNGIAAGFQYQARFSRDGWAAHTGIEIGYDSDGVNVIGNRIRGANLTIESLSPLNLVADEITFGGTANLDENKIQFGNSGNAFMQWTNNHGGFYMQSTAGPNDWAYFASRDALALFANTDEDGNGFWQPYITLNTNGKTIIRNIDWGDAANRYLLLSFDQDLATPGFKPTLQFNNEWSDTSAYLNIGHFSDGTDIFAAQMGGALPLILDFPHVRFRDGTPTAPSIRFSSAAETGFFHNFLPAYIGVRLQNDVRVRFGGSGVELPPGHEVRFLENSTLQRIWANGGDNIQFNTNSNDERLFLSSAGVRIMGSYTLPTADGTAGQVMTTTGAGAVTFQTPVVSWPLTASDYLDMGENQIRFGSVDAFMKFDATNSVLVVQTANNPYAEISSTGGLFLDANVGPALDGNWDPNISLSADGHIQFDSLYQGTAGQRGFRFRADNGLVSGDYEIIRTVRGAATIVGYFGYRANGVSVTDALIRATSTPLVINANGADAAKFDDSATADDCRFLLWDVTAGSFKRVSRGAADSGGTGFRQLVIPN